MRQQQGNNLLCLHTIGGHFYGTMIPKNLKVTQKYHFYEILRIAVFRAATYQIKFQMVLFVKESNIST